MAWVKIDDQFPGHPKVGRLSPAWRPLAVFLHITGLCWCNQYLTDGRIPKAIISRLGSEVECLDIQTQGPITAQHVAEELVSVGLWEEYDDHYIIHDFAEFQPTRREVQARRRHLKTVRSEAGSKAASKRAAKRQANVQQSGKQTCNPDPDPKVEDPPLPPMGDGRGKPVNGTSHPAGVMTAIGRVALTDPQRDALEAFAGRWPAFVEEVTGARGRFRPALDQAAATELVATYPLERIWRLAKAMLKSPRYEGMTRNPKLLAEVAPEIDAWLRGQGQ